MSLRYSYYPKQPNLIKCTKDRKRKCSEENTQMANKYKKRFQLQE